MALDIYRRRRKWIILLAAAGLSGYGAYKIYHLPSVTRKRKKVFNLIKTLIFLAEAVSSSAETVTLVSSDLNRFLRSDSDEIPSSLTQISKIARSDEFSGSVARVSEALTVGILKCFRSAESTELESRTSYSFSDKLLDKLFSTAGSGFASVMVGNFSRNLMIGYYSTGSSRDSDDRTGGVVVPRWINLASREKGREVIADCIRLFVSTAVAAYLDKTMETNTYDEFFSGLTNPKHEPKVKDFMASVCNGAMETLVKSYHQVLTSNLGSSAPIQEKELFQDKVKKSGGWVEQVSSTLAVPSNRQLVLDVTRSVTFETVRSFLEFFLRKMKDGSRRGANVVRDEVVERGLEVVRYISAKSMVTATICLALCMHMSARMRVLV